MLVDMQPDTMLLQVSLRYQRLKFLCLMVDWFRMKVGRMQAVNIVVGNN